MTAGVDGLLEPLVDVLPADHDHRVDAAVEQGAERAALEAVALVLEVVDGEDMGAQLLRRLQRLERGRELLPARWSTFARSMACSVAASIR